MPGIIPSVSSDGVSRTKTPHGVYVLTDFKILIHVSLVK